MMRAPQPGIKKILYHSVLNEGSSSGIEIIKECSICMDSIDGHFSQIKRCNHEFHEECLANWTDAHASCPNCRGSIDAPPSTPSPPRSYWDLFLGL